MFLGPFKKVQPVVAFAARHLDQDLSLEKLARQAGVSSFHLQRIFAATVGESPRQLTQRLRLERAAVLLLTSPDSVLDIALACGFQSHEVFSRAFRKTFQMTPTAYRKRGLDKNQWKDHAELINQVGPCVGLFHTSVNSKENPMTYSITKKQVSPQHVLVVRRRVKPAELAQALGEIFGQTHLYAQRSAAAMAGPPFTRFLEWGPGLSTIEAGMPIAAPDPGEGDVKADQLPGGPVATTIHTGPYDQLPAAHAAVQQWIEAQGLVAKGFPWESYITDPADYPDPKDWKTEIFWPLAG
jgi:AraC-like DNA-binding protein/effector-binding domain-containing protein